MKKLKALILVNAYSPRVYTRQVKRLGDELSARGVQVDARRNDFFPYSITDGDIRGSIDADLCVFLDKDKYVAELIQKSGVRLFNSAQAIAVCDDKMQTHIALAGGGVPMPKTLPGLLCYDGGAALDPATLDRLERELGYPMVVKLSYGSLGKGVYKADDRAALEDIARSVMPFPHLFQQYIHASCGRDMRVIVIGGRVVGGMIRSSDTDFRSNIGLGGRATKTDVPKDIAGMAERAAAILGLDYCGIDFLLGDTPLLCEVNSNAFFDAFESVTNINVAGLYADHIIKVMTK